ncbi:MAG TPA: NUDIX domain-containing protein [Nannocystaceae bacterium]|nr:NUDIX domain-containing protein [Nannocystaceae bacterium]
MPLRRALEPLVRPLFQRWWRLRRGMTLGVRGIATDDQGHVLLVRHTYVDGWCLPGGGVEHGELAHEALAREMAEEGGVLPSAPVELLGVYASAPLFPNDHVLLYRVTAWSPCPTRSEGEIAERGFFPLGDLPRGTTPGTRARLDEAFHGAPRATRWSP